MYSETYGKLTTTQTVQTIIDYVRSQPDCSYNITVGSDSQSFKDYTKVVSVIAVHRVGRGGIFFYDIERTPKMKDLVAKIYYETQKSLDLAEEILPALQELDVDFNFGIHCDLGHKGKTKTMIREITSWVIAMGYPVEVKPSSYVASAIADKFSKK